MIKIILGFCIGWASTITFMYGYTHNDIISIILGPLMLIMWFIHLFNPED